MLREDGVLGLGEEQAMPLSFPHYLLSLLLRSCLVGR